MSRHVLFVCRFCLFSPQQAKYEGKTGGEHLWEHLHDLYPNWVSRDDIRLQAVDCLSGCSHPCTIAIAAAGKFSCLFGNLPPLTAAPQVLTFAERYMASSCGDIPRSQRPALLQSGFLAKIPPAGN